MKKTFLLSTTLFLTLSSIAEAVTIGQRDTFESGTTEGWIAGPAGADDAYLVLTSSGGQGPGSRLTAFNLGQWADNYLTNGVGAIAMDLRNLGATELTIRLEFESPFATPQNFAVTNAGFTLAPGSDWTHVVFPIGLAHLTALGGTSVAGALGDTTVLRIIHATGATEAESVAGQLGVDNISAVPEPGTAAVTLAGLVALCSALRRRVRR